MSNKFTRTLKLGDTRKVWRYYKILKECWVQVTEIYRHEYPDSKSGRKDWFLQSWHFETATDVDPEPQPPEGHRPPWYRRWFGLGPKIPTARVVP